MQKNRLRSFKEINYEKNLRTEKIIVPFWYVARHIQSPNLTFQKITKNLQIQENQLHYKNFKSRANKFKVINFKVIKIKIIKFKNVNKKCKQKM